MLTTLIAHDIIRSHEIHVHDQHSGTHSKAQTNVQVNNDQVYAAAKSTDKTYTKVVVLKPNSVLSQHTILCLDSTNCMSQNMHLQFTHYFVLT